MASPLPPSSPSSHGSDAPLPVAVAATPSTTAKASLSASGKADFRRPSPLVNTRRETAFLAAVAGVPASPATGFAAAAATVVGVAAGGSGDNNSSGIDAATAALRSPTRLEAAPKRAQEFVTTAVAAQEGVSNAARDLLARAAAGAADDGSKSTDASPRHSPRRTASASNVSGSTPRLAGVLEARSFAEARYLSFMPHAREAAFLASLDSPLMAAASPGAPQQFSERSLRRFTPEELSRLSFLPEFRANPRNGANNSIGATAGVDCHLAMLHRSPSSAMQLMSESTLFSQSMEQPHGPTLAQEGDAASGVGAGPVDRAEMMLLATTSPPVGTGRSAHRRLRPEGLPYLVRKEGDCVRVRLTQGRGGPSICVSTLLTDFGARKVSQYDALVDDPPEALELRDEQDPSVSKGLHGKAKIALARVTKKHDTHEDVQYFAHVLQKDTETARATNPFYSDPFYLDNPDIKGERRRKVMAAPGYRCSIVPFVDSKLIDKDIDEQFYLRHPQLQMRELKLTSIRKIKSNLLLLAIEEHSPLEIGTIAFAICYFERLVLKLLVTPENRKLVACVCMILAVKFAETGISSKITMDRKLEYTFSRLHVLFNVNKARILRAEFRVFAGLEFDLLLPQEELVMAQVERLLAGINLTPAEYFRAKKPGDLHEDEEDADDED